MKHSIKKMNQEHRHNRFVAMAVGLAMLGYMALVFAVTAPDVQAQPAEFSPETGMLDIPVIEIDAQRTITDAQLQLQNTDSIMFQLVDYAFDTDPDVQQLALGFNESIALTDGINLRFIAVLAESRCPTDVVCITAGEVTVILRAMDTLEDGNTARTDFGLTLGGFEISEPYINDQYFRLIEANPVPVSTVENSEENYTIVIEVSPQPFLK